MMYKLNRILQHKYTLVIGLIIILSFYFGFTLVNAEVKKPVNPYDNKDLETSNVVLRDGIDIVFEDNGNSEKVQPELKLDTDFKSEQAEETPEEPEEPEETPEEPEEPEETPEEPEKPEETPEEPEEPEETPEEPEEPEKTPEEPEEPEESPEEPEEPEESPEEPEETPEDPEESPEEPEETPEEPEETPKEPEQPEENPGGEGGNNSGEEGTDPGGEGGNNSGEEGTDPGGEGGNNSGEEGTDPGGEGGNNSGEEGTDPGGEGGNNSGEEGTDPGGEGGNNSGEEGTDPEGDGGREPTPPLEPKPPVNDDYLGVYIKEDNIQVKQGEHISRITEKEVTLNINKPGEHFAYTDFKEYIDYIEEKYELKQDLDFFVNYRVTFNGKVVSNSTENQVEIGLRNGVNRIKVDLILIDKAGNSIGEKLIHNTKSFSISYKSDKDIVIYTDLKKDTTVYDDALTFRAYARDHGKKLPQSEIEVKVNGVKTNPISSRTSEYKVKLSKGENEIVIKAGDKEATFIYTYDEYWFDLEEITRMKIERELAEEVPEYTIGNWIYSYKTKIHGENNQIELILDDKHELKPHFEQYDGFGDLLSKELEPIIEVKNSYGSYRVDFKNVEPRGIALYTLTARDKETNETQTRTFIIHNQQESQDRVGHLFIKNNPELQETKEIATPNKHVNLIISGFDFYGNKIDPEQIKVYQENRLIHAEKHDLESAYYTIGKGLGLAHGENRIRIEFTDDLGHITSETYKIFYEEPEIGDVVGQVQFQIEAGTLGLGVLAEPQKLDIIHGETGAELLDRFLKANGFDYRQTGNHQADFYLSYLIRDDLPGNINPPEDLLQILEEENISYYDDGYAKGELGEFDFTPHSGWMYSVNGTYVNIGFADYQFEDGDDVRIRYTLTYGADIGAASNNPDFPFPNLGDW